MREPSSQNGQPAPPMCPSILVCSHVKTPPLPGKGCGCGCGCGCQLSHQPEPRSCFFHPLQRPPRSLLLCSQSLNRFWRLCLQLDSVSVCRQGWNASTCVLLSPLFNQTPVSASKFKDDTEEHGVKEAWDSEPVPRLHLPKARSLLQGNISSKDEIISPLREMCSLCCGWRK